MIIKIPVVLEYIGEMAELGLGYSVSDGLLNTDDVSYCVPDGDVTVIFIKSGILTDEEVNRDLSHCQVVTTLSVPELYSKMRQNLLTQN